MTQADSIDEAAKEAGNMRASLAPLLCTPDAFVAGSVRALATFGRASKCSTDAVIPKVRTGRTRRNGETVNKASNTRRVSSVNAMQPAA